MDNVCTIKINCVSLHENEKRKRFFVFLDDPDSRYRIVENLHILSLYEHLIANVMIY